MRHKMFMLFCMMLFLPLSVSADSISLKCPSEYENGVEFSCDIYGDVTAGIYSVETNVNLVNLTYVTFSASSGLQGGSFYNANSGTYKIGLYGSTLLNGNFKVGTLRLKGSDKSSGKVLISGTVFSDDDRRVSVADTDKTMYLKQIVNNNTTNTTNNNNANNATNNNSSSNNNTNTTNNNKTNNNTNTTTNNNTNTTTNNNTTNNTANNNKTNNTDTTNADDTKKTTDDEVEEYNIDFSNGAYLIDLKIAGYNIDFRSDIFQYNIKIGNEKKLNITPVVSSKDVTYTIIDNDDLKDGSIVTIEVIYKNRDMQHYYINIEKDEKKQTLTFILIGIIVALIVINVIRFLAVRRDKNDKESE